MGSKNSVPCNKERLREVVLVAVQLMMDVMVCAVVAKDPMEDIPRETKTTVIINALDGGKGEEENGSPRSHS